MQLPGKTIGSFWFGFQKRWATPAKWRPDTKPDFKKILGLGVVYIFFSRIKEVKGVSPEGTSY